jgi:hypothetical protein
MSTGSRPAALVTESTSCGATTSGRAVSVCGAMKLTTYPSTPQARIGPEFARLYPVEPAGVAATSPSQRTWPTSLPPSR